MFQSNNTFQTEIGELKVILNVFSALFLGTISERVGRFQRNVHNPEVVSQRQQNTRERWITTDLYNFFPFDGVNSLILTLSPTPM